MHKFLDCEELYYAGAIWLAGLGVGLALGHYFAAALVFCACAALAVVVGP